MKTITEQINEIAEDICDHYCKYAEMEDSDYKDDICSNCPLVVKI